MERVVILVEMGKKEDIEEIIKSLNAEADSCEIKRQGDPSLAEKIEEAKTITKLEKGFNPQLCILLGYKELDRTKWQHIRPVSKRINDYSNGIVISFFYDKKNNPTIIYPS